MSRRPLRARIALSLFFYSLLLGAAMLTLGYVVNERVEQLVWESLLSAELEHLLDHPPAPGESVLIQSGTLRAFRERPGAPEPGLPVALRGLAPGLHDEIRIGSHEYAVLVRPTPEETLYMTIDITELEATESSMTGMVLVGSMGLAALLAGLTWWLAGRLTHSISRLTDRIDELKPDEAGSRVHFDEHLDDELERIVAALNRLLVRTDGYLARERDFLNMASHELRTPVAVISGAVTLAMNHANAPDGLRKVLQRVARASRDMEQLIRMLLVLAKSPDLVNASGSDVDLVAVVNDVIEDHAHLTAQKTLTVEAGVLLPTRLVAPVQLVQVSIANILRNAIEQSDAGAVRVSVDPPGVVKIEDPGHGLSPEEISRIYARIARASGERYSRGIGLELITRICEHLGWQLQMHSESGRGTTVTLDLRSALIMTNHLPSSER